MNEQIEMLALDLKDLSIFLKDLTVFVLALIVLLNSLGTIATPLIPGVCVGFFVLVLLWSASALAGL